MSLLPSFGSVFRNNDIDDNGQHETGRMIDSGDSVQSIRSSNASPVPSVGMHMKGGIMRPPGLGGMAVPSPIGKPGHSYASSASTAQNLTLTPTSSLDGGDIYARQSSPFFGDGPSLSSDYSRRGLDDPEMPPGFTSIGSFDEEDGEHDGLLGLQALRDRAYSSPGPLVHYSSSPPIRFDEGRPLRPRAVSRDNGRPQPSASRPPLSGSSGLSPHTNDHKTYFPSTSGSRSRDHSPTPPGIISRPGTTQYELPPDRLHDPRRRSIGSDSGREFPVPIHTDRYQPSMDQLAQKFGQLGNQPVMVNASGYPPSQPGLQRHQRASSLPGLMRGPQDHYMEEMAHGGPVPRRGSEYGFGFPPNMHAGPENDYLDPRYHAHPYGQEHISRSHIANQRRTSLQVMTGTGAGLHVQNRNMIRRESLDFVPGHNRHPEGVPVMAPNEDMRMYVAEERNSYRGERIVSPALSPLHTHYGGGSHSRHPSDMGASALSSSPASSSGGMRGNYGLEVYSGNTRGRHRPTHSDDDLSHPLIGEHIEMHGDDRGYLTNDLLDPHNSHAGRGRTLSLDQPLPHYGGAASAHVLPNAGSAAQMPKILYNIKFKRTQRTFALGPRLNRELKIGTYVKVEADRGEDLGIVVGKVPPEKHGSSRSSFRGSSGELGPVPPPPTTAPNGAPDLKRIIRLATHDEVALLTMKREEEEELLKICRAKVRQRGLPMNVVDAEYQFDRHKLTFFFEAEGRVDFRELVRDLFSMYKTRIWMQQLDKSTGSSCPAAPEELQSVVMDYGTPIIAPESEYSEFANGTSGDNTD